jgi:hypothetical protein
MWYRHIPLQRILKLSGAKNAQNNLSHYASGTVLLLSSPICLAQDGLKSQPNTYMVWTERFL